MKRIQPNIPEYAEYRKFIELFDVIHYYKFISNLNLPSNLNEKYTTKFYICENSHHIVTFQFNSSTILVLIACMQIPSFSENLDHMSLYRSICNTPNQLVVDLSDTFSFLSLFRKCLSS